MRRPQQQGNHHHHHHHHSNQHHQNCPGSPPSSPIEPRQRSSNVKDESRLARVKRVLTGSLLGRSSSSVESKRVFGARLEHVDSYLDTGVPYVVHRLCAYIENHGFNNASVFRLSGGSPRLTERLRTSFERRGDADLETAGCPSTAATLLRQYLKELPQPLVPSSVVVNLLQIHAHDYANDQATWIERTHQLLLSLPPSHYRLFGYLANYLSKYEARHGRSSGVCGVFAPVVLPHVPPATTLLRDILAEASSIFPDCCAKESGSYSTLINNDNSKTASKDIKGQQVDNTEPTVENTLHCALKPRKRKEHCESCCQERKLIRSNSEERLLDKNTSNTVESIRRVNSHEDFKSDKHLHVLSQLSQLKADMGHGVRCGGLPLHERTNVSPISKPSPLPSPCDILLAAERPECDVEKVRSTERFSRSITPRGRRQNRRRRIHKSGLESDQSSSKENYEFAPESLIDSSTEGHNSADETIGPSFLELLSSGPSRSPSPVRARSLDHEDSNNPVPTLWGFQHRQSGGTNDAINSVDDEKDGEPSDRVDAMLSPRNSLLIPRRFYAEADGTPTLPSPSELGLKTLTKHINGLKKKIKKYEDEFEENFGYRPSHSDKMSNRDVKKLCTELNKLRKEYKLLKEDPIGALRANAKLTKALNTNLTQQNQENSTSINNNNNNNNNSNNNNNNNGQEFKSRTTLMEDMVKEVERKLSEKRTKYGRPDNMEEMTYEQLVDEKTAVQKALLQIEGAFGRPVSKEDRATVRQLYDRYRSLKRLLIRAGSSKNKDSISELATILEHEAMDFTSSSLPGNFGDSDRRASEPDMSHRGILDCIDTLDQLPTDSDSQHSSSEGSRGGVVESLHSLPQEDLVAQQRIMGEEKKRLRRAIKELEVQFEARAGRRMQRQDRGPQVQAVYDSYKQTKAKLRLIDALLAKTA